MRELEFLPSWYRQTRRRKRIVAIEGWTFFTLIVCLGSWLFITEQRIGSREVTLGALQHNVDQIHTEKKMLDEQINLRQQLQTREELIASLGYPVEMTRLLHTLESVMPREMTIIDLDCSTKEQVKQVTSVAAVKPADKQRQTERRLEVRLQGVTPSDVDLANFVGALTKMSFFQQVNVGYARDKIDAGHVLREFEVTFSLDLDQ